MAFCRNAKSKVYNAACTNVYQLVYFQQRVLASAWCHPHTTQLLSDNGVHSHCAVLHAATAERHAQQYCTHVSPSGYETWSFHVPCELLHTTPGFACSFRPRFRPAALTGHRFRNESELFAEGLLSAFVYMGGFAREYVVGRALQLSPGRPIRDYRCVHCSSMLSVRFWCSGSCLGVVTRTLRTAMVPRSSQHL